MENTSIWKVSSVILICSMLQIQVRIVAAKTTWQLSISSSPRSSETKKNTFEASYIAPFPEANKEILWLYISMDILLSTRDPRLKVFRGDSLRNYFKGKASAIRTCITMKTMQFSTNMIQHGWFSMV